MNTTKECTRPVRMQALQFFLIQAFPSDYTFHSIIKSFCPYLDIVPVGNRRNLMNQQRQNKLLSQWVKSLKVTSDSRNINIVFNTHGMQLSSCRAWFLGFYFSGIVSPQSFLELWIRFQLFLCICSTNLSNIGICFFCFFNKGN